MKFAVIIARILLGGMFVFSGIVALLHLIKQPDNLPPDAVAYNSAMSHGYMTFVAILMLVGGILLLVGRFVPLGLVLLGPILVNILLFHFTIMHGGAAIPLVLTLLEVFLIVVYRDSFIRIFDAEPRVKPTV